MQRRAGSDQGLRPQRHRVGDLHGQVTVGQRPQLGPRRRAQHLPRTRLGKAQIRVTIPLHSLHSLTDRIGHGVLDDGTEISPTLARMLACEAGIIPAI